MEIHTSVSYVQQYDEGAFMRGLDKMKFLAKYENIFQNVKTHLTGFENPEKGIFENNPQMKYVVKQVLKILKRKVKKIKFPSHDPAMPVLFVMWLCMGQRIINENPNI